MTPPRPRYRRGDLVVDARTRDVRVRGRRIALTRPQTEILLALFEADGATLPREELLARVGPPDGDASGRTVDLHVSRLRRRLGDEAGAPRYIEAVYGMGYRLAPERNDPSDGRFADAILDALPEAVLILDERLLIRDANRAAEILLGRTRADLAGLACGLATSCQDCEGVSLAGAACLGRAALRGDPLAAEIRGLIQGADGPVPVMFAHARVLPGTGVRLVAVSLRRAA